jgi:hypothetical protein
MKTDRQPLTGTLPRPELVSVLAYVNRSGRSQRCVDGTFGGVAEIDLIRLTAAAGMQ